MPVTVCVPAPVHHGGLCCPQYGFSSGDEEARASIARMLTDELGVSTSPNQVCDTVSPILWLCGSHTLLCLRVPRQLCITAGASSAFDLACATFADAGDTIVVEEPTYFLANPVLADHGLKGPCVMTLLQPARRLTVCCCSRVRRHWR